MSPDLLDTLAAAGISLHVDAGDLVIRAPKGSLTPELRQQIASNKAALLVALTPEQASAGADISSQMPPFPVPAQPAHLHTAPDSALLPEENDGSNLCKGACTGSAQVAAYRCWYSDCGGIATGPWQPIGPDCWQGECSNGHIIQRAEASFVAPLECERGRPVRPPIQETMAGNAPRPLWLYDRLHPTPGTDPWPAPPDLTAEQIAAEVDAARRQYQPVRFKRRPSPVRDPDLVARLLDAGERLDWPALALRPGERLAAGQGCWEVFVTGAPVDRLQDAERAAAEGFD